MGNRVRAAARRAGALALCVGAAGCRLITGDDVVCTAQFVPGITVTVRDAASGAAVPGARVVARDGAYADTANIMTSYPSAEGAVYQLAGERAGTYTVRVEAAGYQAFDRAGVRVTADACHVRTVAVTAALRR